MSEKRERRHPREYCTAPMFIGTSLVQRTSRTESKTHFIRIVPVVNRYLWIHPRIQSYICFVLAYLTHSRLVIECLRLLLRLPSGITVADSKVTNREKQI